MALTIRVRIDGVRPALRALSKIGRDANDKIREASTEIAEGEATRIRVAGFGEGRQAAIVAGTVRVRRDRVPAVEAGGGRRIGRRRKPAGKLVFGSEFGAATLKQYRPHRGAQGYWIFPTVERDQPLIEAQWNAAVDEILGWYGAGRG